MKINTGGSNSPETGTESQAIGRSRGGVTTKIMALTDALGNLIDFRLLPGQAHDLRGTAALIKGLTGGKLHADRAFDANWLREALAKAGTEAFSGELIPRINS